MAQVSEVSVNEFPLDAPLAASEAASLAPITTTDLCCIRGGVTILKNINLQVQPGQCIALLGKNGAGKTTLLETLLGFLLPDGGEARVWGHQAHTLGEQQKQRIGFVPQQEELLAGLTGAEHLRLFANFRPNWNQPLVERLVRDWLIPTEQTLASMSLGQRQKLAILLAIAHEPDLLVLDEPVASLDPIARRQFLQQLVDMAGDERRAIIFSTHIVSDVERVANQVWMLRDGEMIYQGELDQLKESLVRVSFRPNPDSLALFSPDTILRQQLLPHQCQLLVRDWNQSRAARFPEKFTLEHLGLEDIFWELNQ